VKMEEATRRQRKNFNRLRSTGNCSIRPNSRQKKSNF
jgi:hypothetical protein